LLGGLLGGVAGYVLRASFFGRGLCAALSLTEACGGMRWSVVIYITPPPNWHSRKQSNYDSLQHRFFKG
jgi:hypothetical protein